jgi:signal transduction histidine kinase
MTGLKNQAWDSGEADDIRRWALSPYVGERLTPARAARMGIRDRVVLLLRSRPLHPMEIRLPLLAAGFIFLAAIGTLSYYEGIRDESLFLFDRSGKEIAHARRDGAPDRTEIPVVVFAKRSGTLESASGEVAWVWRPLMGDGQTIGTLVAALDVAPLNDGRRLLSLYAMAAALVVSLAVAFAGIWIIRAQLRPITTVTRHLEQVAVGRVKEIPESASRSSTVATLRNAFNQMVAATREREAMANRLAEQNRAAVLGRLAATIVHEVKNPLGGMQTAVETIKKYGEDTVVRAEAVGLIERGLETVEQVIDATLESYKLPDKRRSLRTEDLSDVTTLIEAEARQRGIKFASDVRIPASVPVPAVETRQVLLNLLLNACRATPREGIVSLLGEATENELRLHILDSGPGIDPVVANVLEGGEAAETDGLGIPIVRRLIDRLNGTINVGRVEPNGTRLSITLPFAPEEVAA